jgi:hypothetical protein
MRCQWKINIVIISMEHMQKIDYFWSFVKFKMMWCCIGHYLDLQAPFDWIFGKYCLAEQNLPLYFTIVSSIVTCRPNCHSFLHDAFISFINQCVWCILWNYELLLSSTYVARLVTCKHVNNTRDLFSCK